MTTTRREDFIAVALLMLILLVVFADVVAGWGVFYFRDFSSYYFPVKKMMRDVVLGGEFPWWTRAYSAGQPLAANPEHEVFYPLTWLILLPNYVAALHLQVLLHVAITLAGMYALLRSLALRPFASFFGALTFGLGGVTLSNISLLPILYCAAWLPLTCLFSRRFLLHGGRRAFALAVMFLALQMLVGEPTTILQTALIVAAYAAYRAWRDRMIRPIASAAAIGAVAALIAAIEVVPAFDFARDSVRARPFPFEIVADWSMPWPKLLELIAPNALGHVVIKEMPFYWATALYGVQRSPFLLCIYPGILITILALAGIVSRRPGTGLVAALSLIAIVLAAGDHTPVLRWLYDAGLATRLRYPEKFLLTFVFAMTIFAAQALDGLQAGDRRIISAARTFAIGFALLVVAAFAWSFSSSYAQRFALFFSLPAIRVPIAVGMSRYDLLIATARGVVAVALLATTRWAKHPAWMLAAIALAVADIARLAPEVAPRMSTDLFDRPAVRAPWDDRDYRIFHEAAEWLSDTATAQQWAASGRRYWLRRNGLFPMLPAAWGLPTAMNIDVDHTSLLPTSDFVRAAIQARELAGERGVRLSMAMSNARYRAIFRPFDPSVYENDPRRIQAIEFIDTVRQPRYYFGWPIVRIRDRNDFAMKVAGAAWPTSVAFVQVPVRVDARGIVESVRESSNTAAIGVESPGRSLLVMSVTPHRYWHVAIDGQRVAPIIANIGYQAVVVGPGRHFVTMRYRNDVVVISACVSLLAAISTLLFALRRTA